jgi:hypothetical protein
MADPKFLFIVTPGYQKTIALDNIASFAPSGSGTEFILKEIVDNKNVKFFCDEPYLTIVDSVRAIIKKP